MKFAGKIALEEHIAIPDTVNDSERYFTPDVWPRFRKYLLDIQGQLLSDMDENGIEISFLSINSPGIQAIADKKKAIDTARRSNDYMAEQVAKKPHRFQAFAALPMQDPDAAAQELTRCVQEFGFKGALVNGFSQIDTEENVVYLDDPRYLDFWATAESLDAPFYLHPRDPLPSWTPILKGMPWLTGSMWAFGVETSTHALRLLTSGIFDRYPKLTLILGHLGETLPNAMWRIDHRISKTPHGVKSKKKIAEYMQTNVYVTTSGNYCTSTLVNDILTIGADRILFAVDYPFEQVKQAADWFDNTDGISEMDRLKIARTNSEKLFKLGASKTTAVPA